MLVLGGDEELMFSRKQSLGVSIHYPGQHSRSLRWQQWCTWPVKQPDHPARDAMTGPVWPGCGNLEQPATEEGKDHQATRLSTPHAGHNSTAGERWLGMIEERQEGKRHYITWLLSTLTTQATTAQRLSVCWVWLRKGRGEKGIKLHDLSSFTTCQLTLSE